MYKSNMPKGGLWYLCRDQKWSGLAQLNKSMSCRQGYNLDSSHNEEVLGVYSTKLYVNIMQTAHVRIIHVGIGEVYALVNELYTG